MQCIDIPITIYYHISFPGNIILLYTEKIVLNVSLSPIFKYNTIGLNVFQWHVEDDIYF